MSPSDSDIDNFAAVRTPTQQQVALTWSMGNEGEFVE